MTELYQIIKAEADWLFKEEVAEVDPENFDAVYETITGNFKLGAVAMASKLKNVYEILQLKDDKNARLVLLYLEKFIEEQAADLEHGTRYLKA